MYPKSIRVRLSIWLPAVKVLWYDEKIQVTVNLEFNMPSRGIIGLRTNVLTASAGEAVMAHRYQRISTLQR
jgi:predicted membrane GTPase involved in stress response